ncbi:AlpA family phage regulatory protein, partial [Herbaspirillum sp. HC18]
MPKIKQSRTGDSAVALNARVALVARTSDAVADVRSEQLHWNEGDHLDRGLASSADDELWSLKTVVAKTCLSRSSIYSYVELGLFPRQRRLGPRRVGWLASQV